MIYDKNKIKKLGVIPYSDIISEIKMDYDELFNRIREHKLPYDEINDEIFEWYTHAGCLWDSK